MNLFCVLGYIKVLNSLYIYLNLQIYIFEYMITSRDLRVLISIHGLGKQSENDAMHNLFVIVITLQIIWL